MAASVVVLPQLWGAWGEKLPVRVQPAAKNGGGEGEAGGAPRRKIGRGEGNSPIPPCFLRKMEYDKSDIIEKEAYFL